MESNGLISGFLKNHPLQLQIGITDFCNLHCRFCMQGIDPTFRAGKKGFMDFSLWRKIISSLRNFNYPYSILLIWIGESLLHPQFIEFVEYLYNFGGDKFWSLIFYTNMTCLDKKKLKRLLSLVDTHPNKRMEIVFSFVGWNAETVFKINGNTNWERDLVLIKDFVGYLCRNPRFNLSVDLQFVVTEENSAETISFFNFWKEILQKYGITYQLVFDYKEIEAWENNNFKISILREGSDEATFAIKNKILHTKVLKELGILPEEKQIIEAEEKEQPSTNPTNGIKCTSPWEYYVVNWDGKVTACCKDFDMELSYGDFQTEEIEEILQKPKLKALRKAILENDFSHFPKCAACPGLRGKVENDLLKVLKGE
jgi:radical SAM protein with 4Fe4S-binding SPASM domain